MTKIDYVSRGEFEELKRQIRELGTQSPLESSAVKNGRVRFIGGLLRVEAGGQVQIVGSLEIDGVTIVTGTFDVTGPVTLDGPWSFNGDGSITGDMTVTGAVTFNGLWTFNGDGSITGNVGLTGDLNVTGAGRINIGTSMVLNPAGSNGRVEFANGAQVFTDGTSIQVVLGNSVVQVTNSYARLQHGGDVFEINATGVRASLGAIPTYSGSGLPAGTMRMNGSGYWERAA